MKHFKIEQKILEHIYWGLSVENIRFEVQLKIEDNQKNLIKRFKNWTVFKPCITVLKPPRWRDTAWSKSWCLRNSNPSLFDILVLDNIGIWAVYVLRSREKHLSIVYCWVLGFLLFLALFFTFSNKSSGLSLLLFSVLCCGLDYLHLYCLLGVGVEIYIKEREFLWQRRSHICRSRSCKFFLLFYLCCVNQNPNFVCFYLPWVARSHSGI